MTVLCVLHSGEATRPPAATGVLCGRHLHRLDDLTDEIDALVLDTRRIVDGGAPTDAGPRAGHAPRRADPPAPGNLDLMVLFDPRTGPMPAVTSVIAAWTLWLADERPITNPLPKSLLGQLRLLARHRDWIAGQGVFVGDYLDELGQVRRALAAVVRDVEYRRRGVCHVPTEVEAACACYCHLSVNASCNVDLGHAKPVPYCGPHERRQVPCGGTLIERNGEGVVSCRKCRNRWTSASELAHLYDQSETA